jgi:predicted nuclease with TOPRIM domain
MLYSTLSNDELERWCYASPDDVFALLEMIKRAPAIIDNNDEVLVEAEERADRAESESSNLEDELNEANDTIERLQSHIEELESAGA